MQLVLTTTCYRLSDAAADPALAVGAFEQAVSVAAVNPEAVAFVDPAVEVATVELSLSVVAVVPAIAILF